MYRLYSVLMRGIGQVMFQNNVLSGVLMLSGIAVGNWRAALLALAGNAIGNLTALLCRYPKNEINDGLYGFNGTLVGIASGVFFSPGWPAFLLMAAGAAISTGITRIFLRTRKPGYTAPFIVATWIMLVFALLVPSLRLPGGPATPAATPDWTGALSFHFGQVMFEGRSLSTGLLFLAGIAVNDRRGALYALWGAVLPLSLFFLSDDYASFNAGLYGYNGVLCAIALAGASGRDFLWATAAVVLSIALQRLGMAAGIVTLTAPFVLAVWIITAIRTRFRQ